MRPNGFWRPKSLLVLDSALSHTKRSVLSSFQKHYNTDVAVIPGGMTPLLQPADVSWNKPFKSLMKEKWLEWLNEGEEEYTRSKKRKSASYETVVHMSDCWKSISEDLIKKSLLNVEYVILQILYIQDCNLSLKMVKTITMTRRTIQG